MSRILTVGSAFTTDKYDCSRARRVPLRLFDCFGFSIPSILLVEDLCVRELVDFRFNGGFGAIIGLDGWEARSKVVGEGIVIVSIETWRSMYWSEG